jgi:hypothetical protein
MRIGRRREAESTKESALAEAQRATRSLRRKKERAERHRAGKQNDPTYEITGGPWVEGGD